MGGGTVPTLSTHLADMSRARKRARKIDEKTMMITVLLLRDSGAPGNVWASQSSSKIVIYPHKRVI